MGHTASSSVASARPFRVWGTRSAAMSQSGLAKPHRTDAQSSDRIDLALRVLCIFAGFGLGYVAFGASDSSILTFVLLGVAAAVLLAVYASLPVLRSTRSDRGVDFDSLESAVLFSNARAGATAAERSRIARDMHDGVGQDVAALRYLVDDLSRATNDSEHRSDLLDLGAGLSRILSDLRMTVADLRRVTDEDRLGPALTDYTLALGKRSSMVVHLAIEEAPERLQPEVETELLRIAQEAVANAAHHACAGNLWVTCRLEPPFATISIDDDGIGAAVPRPDHFGLQIMHERAERIGAVLAIDDRPEGGTRVTAVLKPRESPESELQQGVSDVLQRPSRR
jgi:signal transduction histidine kinase